MMSVGCGLAEALYPWWLACARLLSGDDPTGPSEEPARAPGDGESSGDASGPADMLPFWRGDEATLAAIYRAHARALLGAVRSMVGPADAESVVQEVFVELLRNHELRRRFSGGSLAVWLGAIARRKGLEHLRSTGRVSVTGNASSSSSAAEPVDPSPEPRLEARDLLLRFLKTGVSAEQAEFFQRRFIDGQTQVQVAAALGVPRSTLEGWEHRLAERLRRFVREETP